jgi:hypothetical protein
MKADDENYLDKTIENIDKQTQKPTFNKTEHDSNSRLEVTKLILTWYFALIVCSFLFVPLYNLLIAFLNDYYLIENPITYIEVSPTVSIVTNTLNGIIGFVIGYYFKNKDE